jgi:hypothetical protein
MSNTTYNARNMVATNGQDFTATTDAIVERHQADIDAFLEANPDAFAPEYEDRMVSYGQDYYFDGGHEVDDENEMSVADDLAALHDLTTDDMDVIELHGQTYVGDLQCYREIGTGSQRDKARDLALIDTRADTIAECKADRAKQVRRHLKLDRPTRGETVAAGIVKSQKRAAKVKGRLARRVAAAEARAAR